MKLRLHERDYISGKQIEYAIPMLVILAKNTFHVVGFNLLNTIYRCHISTLIPTLTHDDIRSVISVWGSGFAETALTLSKLYFWWRQLCATLSLCTMF